MLAATRSAPRFTLIAVVPMRTRGALPPYRIPAEVLSRYGY